MIGSGIQKVMEIHWHSMVRVSLLLFFQNKGSGRTFVCMTADPSFCVWTSYGLKYIRHHLRLYCCYVLLILTHETMLIRTLCTCFWFIFIRTSFHALSCDGPLVTASRFDFSESKCYFFYSQRKCDLNKCCISAPSYSLMILLVHVV
jgi:hypothetical protein